MHRQYAKTHTQLPARMHKHDSYTYTCRYIYTHTYTYTCTYTCT